MHLFWQCQVHVNVYKKTGSQATRIYRKTTVTGYSGTTGDFFMPTSHFILGQYSKLWVDKSHINPIIILQLYNIIYTCINTESVSDLGNNADYSL